MAIVVRGKVWKFGDNIDTTLLNPKFAAGSGWEMVRKYILHTHPNFNKEVQPGDVIVAGQNFGCGQASGEPPMNLKRLGIGCVVAESFGRLFFRNCVALALPILPCHGVAELFAEGDELELNLDEAKVRNLTKGRELQGKQLTQEMMEIISGGGIMEILTKEAALGKFKG